MFFSKLRLKNFKRTALAGYKDITITPNSPLLVVLGTNGCGKTSLTRQFTPWLPEQEHFFPGGEKEFCCKMEGVEYRTVSVLKSGWKHEFWRDGENMNPGGTGTVQKELIKRYFGLTQEIVSLLVGDTSFTTMPVNKRRELFTELSPTDLSYALGVHNRLKTGLRDTQGVRKHLEKRISQETAKVIDDATAEQYASLAKQLNEEIQILLLNKDQSLNPHLTQRRLEETKRSITTHVEQLLGIELRHDTLSNFSSVEELEAAHQALGLERHGLSAKRQQMLSEFVELSATLAELKERSIGSKDEIESRLRALNDFLSKSKTQFDFTFPEELRIAHQETLEFEESLSSYVLQLANWLSDGSDFTVQAQQDCNEALNKASEELRAIKRHINSARDRLAHLEHSNDVDCPSCKTKFVPGERPGERDRLKDILARGVAAEESKNNELRTLGEQAERFSEFQQTVQKIRQIVSAYPRCRGLFDAMVEKGLPYKTTQQTLAPLWLWKTQLEQAFEVKQAQATKQQLEEALERILLSDDGSEVRLSERSVRLEKEIYALGLAIDRANEDYELYGRLLANFRTVSNRCGALDGELVPQYLKYVSDAIGVVRNELIDEVLEEHYAQLGTLSNRLKERDVSVALLSDLQQQLEEAKAREVAYTVLLDELSPTDGLIAEQLSGFIASFTKVANALLEKIWTYPLRVLPCGIENDELNYQFPIEVGHERERASDVSKGSEAQRDIIDFVFVLALGCFVKFPVFADELGSSFDEEHRARVWSFVRDYIDAGRAPQAFMISHYAANHTALSNADLLVVSPDNITVPRKYNECVMFA